VVAAVAEIKGGEAGFRVVVEVPGAKVGVDHTEGV
jgi:hypothetical protein